ncbi:hypothetical protein PEBR_14662 [Penicillium brasilianum]|uniref:Uncharacterized protein n=1 Tax=Penicillium brasilianum TaxID=104259 RepID=A0A1S9RR88_PENBI|nr:hypothetical protein PEBR_14662 [Penicillium brasilianum]
MSEPANYVVGWICAIATEYVAAQEFLDEEHEQPTFVSPNDTNNYTLGKIGGHNVVIAVFPDGEYGTASAASVATNMLNSFPNIRIGLMVGIAGGVPSERHDVRLGDVVVSTSRNGEGGVFQYDFGKSLQGQSFQHTYFLNQAPTTLRTAITGIRAQYKRKGHRLQEAVNKIIDGNMRLRQEYQKPQPNIDRLFKAEVIHDLRGCAGFCADNPFNLIPRRERTEYEDNPVIHYGLIASANQLMKDARIRDRLAADKDVLCFEMSAAGLMNSFPCLVIRGICDYSDSHSNKEWQGYAAMVAAAYAKDLLSRIPTNRVAAEKRIGDILSGLQDAAEAHRDIAQRQLDIQENALRKDWSDDREECLQLFRLTSGSKDATYEWYKDHVEARIEGTCEWFLHHQNFQKWLEQDAGPLFVSADPGCGKSVLAKYLIDDRLPRSATICYFFFKDQDQNTIRQALCAVLHQLFSQKPLLVEHAMKEFKKNGNGLINSTRLLWTILGNAVRDPHAGTIIIVLDALDECAESEIEDLIKSVQSQFRSDHCKLKYLLTSRPYEQIVCKFMGLLGSFPYVRIPGEEESESVSREVNHVIQFRVEQLAKEKQLSVEVKNHLAKKLLRIPHRTYLWVYLVFDYLAAELFKKTPNGIDSTIATMPKSVYEAYEQILSKSKKGLLVRRALSIILVASRPLTLSEMNVALNVDYTSKSNRDLDLEEDNEFMLRLRTECGLFVSVYHNRVYFLHQTAREFLLARSQSIVLLENSWQHSITGQEGHRVLAEVCVVYLGFLNTRATPRDTKGEIDQHLDCYKFIVYAAKNWVTHFLKAGLSASDDIVHPALSICDPNSKSCSAWFSIQWNSTFPMQVEKFTTLTISSYFGLEIIVKLLLDGGADCELKDSHGEKPLSWAARNRHDNIVKLLLHKGAECEAKEIFGQSLLSWAVRNDHEGIVKPLLDRGADSETKDSQGQTPLSWAAETGREAMVKLLLDGGADCESKDSHGETPLSWAARNGHDTIVNLLLHRGAECEAKEIFGQTLLSWAARNGREAIVKPLLDRGADCESKSLFDKTPLSWAAETGHEAIVKLLLDRDVQCEAKDIFGQTPLSWAAENGHEAIVKLLLDRGADCKSKDNHGRTPLEWAARNGHKAIFKMLVDRDAHLGP